jgi:hypothetical protein
MQEWQLLESKGIKETAKITAINSYNPETTNPCYACYDFKVNGEIVNANSNIEHHICKKLSIGTEIPIIYLPDDPSISEHIISHNNDLNIYRTGGLMGIVLTILSFGLLYIFYKNRKTIKTIKENGTIANAIITKIKDHGNILLVHHSQLFYEFTDATGGKHTGKSEVLPTSQLYKYEKGDKIIIAYNFLNPAENTWVGEYTSAIENFLCP